MKHFALAALLLLPAAHAAPVIFFDGTFNNGDWSSQVLQQQAPLTVTDNGQIGAGGNPGSYRQATVLAPQSAGPISASANLASFHNVFSYDPSVSGAIASILFEYDIAQIGSVGSGLFRPFLRQDGNIFAIFTINDSSGPAWISFQHLSTSASDWGNIFGGPALPDFSASGQPFEFGYRMSITLTCAAGTTCSTTTVVGGIDNYRVTITPEETNTGAVPEPATLATVGFTLAALAWRRRRSRGY